MYLHWEAEFFNRLLSELHGSCDVVLFDSIWHIELHLFSFYALDDIANDGVCRTVDTRDRFSSIIWFRMSVDREHA
jgi:hypothetical protein